tara:strand:- start:162 stop:473 length:312 start_codon:yes stop_codon:yes gene_type:complete
LAGEIFIDTPIAVVIFVVAGLFCWGVDGVAVDRTLKARCFTRFALSLLCACAAFPRAWLAFIDASITVVVLAITCLCCRSHAADTLAPFLRDTGLYTILTCAF